MNKRQVGSNFEHEAVVYLQSLGYSIREVNFYCKAGEIDIIADNEGYLCFIEVKYRESEQDGFPEEAVDFRKAEKITRSAVYYMNKHGISDSFPCRFDVVAILGKEITLIKNAFEAVI